VLSRNVKIAFLEYRHTETEHTHWFPVPS